MAVRVPFAILREHVTVFAEIARVRRQNLFDLGVIPQLSERVQDVRRVAEPKFVIQKWTRRNQRAVVQEQEIRFVGVERALHRVVGQTNVHALRE
ncbi:MAG: hypothetical protein DCC52_03850 [Chloroflexi bacterium]|nr:MAG: hypothetical protein DCC52_03850 [Chloroflexota bacterium]